MKLTGRKATVFWVNHFTLLALYALTAIFAGAAIVAVGPTIIVMIVMNGAAYIGGNAFSAWQKSKYFQPGLVEQEK